MGTKRARNSKRHGQGASNNRRPRMKKDAGEQAVLEVIERERRNLQRASAVLASLSVAAGIDGPEIDTGDVAEVARQLIDAVTDALDCVQLRRAAEQTSQPRPP
jgi:hypothetical protein